MAIVSVPSYYWPYPVNCANVAPAYTGGTLNASGDRYAFAVQCPKAGTLDKFEFMTGAVSNNPDNGIRLSFQDISATTGNPDAVQDQYRDITGVLAANTWQVPGLMTSDGTDTGVKRTVTKGEYVACVIDFVSFVAADSFLVRTLRHDQQTQGYGFGIDGSSGAWIKQAASVPVLALKYDDGTYANFAPQPFWPLSAINTYTYNSGSTPDEYALKFQLPYAARVAGVWAYGDFDNDFDLVLYDNASTALATYSVDKDHRSWTTGSILEARFSSSISLSANTNYRIAVKPGVSNVAVYGLGCPSASYLGSLPAGSNAVLSTRTDAGAWTDGTTEQLFAGLIIDGVDVSTGGGSFAFVG